MTAEAPIDIYIYDLSLYLSLSHSLSPNSVRVSLSVLLSWASAP